MQEARAQGLELSLPRDRDAIEIPRLPDVKRLDSPLLGKRLPQVFSACVLAPGRNPSDLFYSRPSGAGFGFQARCLGPRAHGTGLPQLQTRGGAGLTRARLQVLAQVELASHWTLRLLAALGL